MMRLFINGQERQAPELSTVAQLAAWLQLPPFGTAIELNGEVIRRSEHPDVRVKDGDRLEVVRLVGGG